MARFIAGRGWVLAVAFLLATVPVRPVLGDDAPSTISTDALVARTRGAIEQLGSLDRKSTADREAFTRSRADLASAITEIQVPLPGAPKDLSEMETYDDEVVSRELAIAEAYQKAWERQRQHRQRGAEALELLETLARDLPSTHARLVERATALRALLIEAQRRIDRQDVDLEAFDLPPGSRGIEEWVKASKDIAAQGDAVSSTVSELVAGLERDREAFSALPPEDPEVERRVGRLYLVLSGLSEANAIGQEQRARLAEAPPETVPAVVTRELEEWQARQAAAKRAEAEFTEAETARGALARELDALAAPRRGEIAVEEGRLPAVEDAERDVRFAEALIAHMEEVAGLRERAHGALRTVLERAEEAEVAHQSLRRQLVKVWTTVEHAGALVESGDLTDWSVPEGAMPKVLWDAWRRDQLTELDRLEVVSALPEEAASARALETYPAQIAKERTQLMRAKERLSTELSYVEVVGQMTELSDEELLALLAADGEIVRKLAEIAQKETELREAADVATNRCLAAVRVLRAVENPYSRAAIRIRVAELAVVREAIEQLEPGAILPDQSATLLPTPDVAGSGFPEELHDTAQRTAVDLATIESRHLGIQQQFARVFLDYFASIERALHEMREGRDERRRLDAEIESQMAAAIREEKRRYATALEVQRRIGTESIPAAKRPEGLEGWLERQAIGRAEAALRDEQRQTERFYERADYEVERAELLASGASWARIRSESADARARLVGRPLALLESALMPLQELGEVDRNNLDYTARSDLEADAPWHQGLVSGFTSREERSRFENPLLTYYRERANSRRVLEQLTAARDAYHQMAELCGTEREAMLPSRQAFLDISELRLFDYHAARYTAAVARHPDHRARLEDAFRQAHERDLRYRLKHELGDVAGSANLLFGAESRLIASRSLNRDVDLYLSKLGLEQEMGWYQTQNARIASLLEVEESREEDLNRRIAGLRGTYSGTLKDNALRGMGVTLVIPLIAFVLVRLVRRGARKLESRAKRVAGEDALDRQRRMETVTKTATAAVSLVIWTIALVYILARLGLDVTPIVASASVVGLAVAFGAQTLIRDFFSGFFILLENQFTIGDVVKLGQVRGTVEKISLRITVLRDLEGVAHYIPNGTIAQVSNLTQGWSRVVMEISVPYSEDPDRASKILEEALLELASDPTFGASVTEPPVVAGVQNLTDRAQEIRVMIKTRPGKQWEIAREARRRIKKRLDEHGIQVPFPQRVVHHVYQGEEKGEPRGDAAVE